MRLKFVGILLLIAFCALSSSAQNKQQVVTAANGQTHPLAGRDRTRNADEIVYYTPEYYKKSPPSSAGVDVLVTAGGKIAVIQDRAGAVYIEKKSDPGAVKPTGDKDFILSGNGAARRWILANLKAGDAVSVGEIVERRNAAGEIIPAASLPCFEGAYYRKAVTSFDVWTGIAGIVKLPTPKVDENRLNEKTRQPLDNFSIYMGGRAGNQEIDAGLTWEFTKDENGKLSERRNAWRPFWRNEAWHNAPAEKQFYWYPGDVVQIAVLAVGPKKLRLVVADATPQPKRIFQTDFDAAGFAPGVARQFKRVNAIDQFGNEGKPVQPTRAEVTGAEWLQTILLRGEGAAAKQIPMDGARMTDMRCPAANIIVGATDAAKGAEKIDIYGTPRK